MFLTEALRVGRDLSGSAVRHGGRCTWADNDLMVEGSVWRRRASFLGPEFATGTAGIGWFLARLGSAYDGPRMTGVAVEALRQSLKTVEDLFAKGKLGFFDGATGVAWALIDGGRALDSAELCDSGLLLGLRVAEVISGEFVRSGEPGLWNGNAGIVIGLLGLHALSERNEFLNAVSAPVEHLLDWISRSASHATQPSRSVVGLARGASGVGLALAVHSAHMSDHQTRDAAFQAFGLERSWLDPERAWYGASAHKWAEDQMVTRSFCSGAAGIGIARLGAFLAIGSMDLVAEAAAAIDVIRKVPIAADGPDASVCHGSAGEIDLLVTASTALSEPVHLDAARELGQQMIHIARVRRTYASGLGDIGPSPAFLLGLAGSGMTLLRLHDPMLVPSVAVPPVLP